LSLPLKRPTGRKPKGADGPTYIVSVQARNVVQTFDSKTGELKLRSKWVTVKTYGVSAKELGGTYTPGLMDAEACLE
jgi:hypothetical protein